MRDTVEMMNFGMPFVIDENGKAARIETDDYFDGISSGSDSLGMEYITGIPKGWETVTGITGQDSYDGAIMHSSEFMTERNMAYLFDANSTNVFVFTTFFDDDHEEWCDWEEHDQCDMMGDGWLILRRV